MKQNDKGRNTEIRKLLWYICLLMNTVVTISAIFVNLRFVINLMRLGSNFLLEACYKWKKIIEFYLNIFTKLNCVFSSGLRSFCQLSGPQRRDSVWRDVRFWSLEWRRSLIDRPSLGWRASSLECLTGSYHNLIKFSKKIHYW